MIKVISSICIAVCLALFTFLITFGYQRYFSHELRPLILLSIYIFSILVGLYFAILVFKNKKDASYLGITLIMIYQTYKEEDNYQFRQRLAEGERLNKINNHYKCDDKYVLKVSERQQQPYLFLEGPNGIATCGDIKDKIFKFDLIANDKSVPRGLTKEEKDLVYKALTEKFCKNGKGEFLSEKISVEQ